METPIVYLIIGLVVGALAAWFIAKYRLTLLQQQRLEAKYQENYVSKDLFESLQTQSDLYRDDLLEKEQELRELGSQLSAKEQDLFHLKETLEKQEEELTRLQIRFRQEFENIANRLLEEKSEKFVKQNEVQLQHLLNPLREQIKAFETGIEKRYLDETKEKISLKKEIEQLRDLNQQLSEDANKLAAALKGDNKTQGDWGELQLELLLEKAGLVKDIHYLVQQSYKDVNGKDKRPDFIIQLPGNKHLVIDSKVSLVAYERFFNEDDERKRTLFLKAHVDSLRSHIKDLASKNYQHLYQINSPDYLLLFVPIEPAFSLAASHDQRLFLDALDRNVVIVTSSTLLATMRTVSFIWRQEKQKKSVLEIARQSGLLYDKFCAFVEDLKTVGQRLQSARVAYDGAMNKLSDSRKFGDTLIGRAEKIKELGAKATKSLPKELLE